MKRKFFLKLLSVYILIVLVYNLIAIGIFYFTNNQIIKLETSNLNYNFLKQAADKSDTKLNIAFNLINKLKSDENIKDFIRNDQSDYYNIKTVQTELAKNQNTFSDLGYTIAISKLYDNRVIAPTYTLNIQEYFKDFGLMDYTKDKIIENFELQDPNSKDFGIQSRIVRGSSVNYSYLTIIRKDFLDSGEIFYIFLSFDEKMFLPELQFADREALLIVRNDKIIAMNTLLERTQLDELILQDTFKITGNDLSSYTRYEISEFIINSIPSKIQDWHYIYISSKGHIQGKLWALLKYSLITYLLLACIGGTIVFFISKKMYQPISSVIGVFNKFYTDENKDEMAYLEETAYKINESNNKMREIIKKNKIPLKAKFLRDWLIGMLTIEEVNAQLDHHNIHCSDKGFTVCTLEILNFLDLENNFTKEGIINIKSQTLMIINQALQNHLNCELLEWDYNRFIIIFFDTDIPKIKNLLSNALSNIEINFDLHFVAAIGYPVTSVYDIQNSYSSTLLLLEYRFAIGEKFSIISTENLDNLSGDSFYYPIDLEKELITNVVRGNSNDAFLILNRIIEKNFKEKCLNNEALSQLIITLVSTINRIIQALNKSATDFFDEGTILYVELKMCKNGEELEEKLRHIFYILICKIEDEKNNTDHTLANQLVDYIHKNYNRDVSFSEIAEHFNFSRGYLSSFFKNATGENFKDYINMYRVKIAKRMMDENHSISVKELAEQVGCNSSNTFIRIFSKHEGITPGQYLNNLHEI